MAETFKSEHSYNSFLNVIFCSAICYAVQGGSNLEWKKTHRMMLQMDLYDIAIVK